MGHLGADGLVGQVTHIRAANGMTGYVRENLDMDTFMMTSNERLEANRRVPKKAVQVLELACLPDWFNQLREIVSACDHLNRPVLRSAKFTVRVAENIFEGKDRRLR